MYKFILVSARMTIEPVSLHGNVRGLVLCSIFSSAFALRYSLPPFWILFQFVIPKPFISIVWMNSCNPLSVFVYCCSPGFSISFHLSLKHPVCVSFTTINLNLHLFEAQSLYVFIFISSLGFCHCPMLCCLLRVLIHVYGETKP